MAPEHPSLPRLPPEATDSALLALEADALAESRALRLSRSIRDSEVALTETTFKQLLEALFTRDVVISLLTEGSTRIRGRLNTLGSDFLGVVNPQGIECLVTLDCISGLEVDENQHPTSAPAQLAGSLVGYIDSQIPLGTPLVVSAGLNGRFQTLEFLGTTQDCIVFTSASSDHRVYIRTRSINEIRLAIET